MGDCTQYIKLRQVQIQLRIPPYCKLLDILIRQSAFIP